MARSVEISFECLPFRSVTRWDIPMDASPGFRAKCERMIEAMKQHGTHNSYYLHNARCVYRLTNRDDTGMLEFGFEGTLLTNDQDAAAASCDLRVELSRETCDWLTEPVVKWFHESVSRAVMVEFDLYIAAGDLEKTRARLEKVQAEMEGGGGFVGMYL